MKLLIVAVFVGVAWATPPLYNTQELQGDELADDSLDSTNYIDPDAIAVDIVNNDFVPSAVNNLQEIIEVADNYLKEKALEHLDIPRNEENTLEVNSEPEQINAEENNLREEDDADKVLLANSDDEIIDTDKVLDAAPLSDDTNSDDSRQFDVVQIADVPLENIPYGNTDDQLQVVELGENNDDSMHFVGIMQIAPSELDSLRVEFNDDMEHEIFENQDEEAPQLPRGIIFSDPNLR